MSKTHQLKTDPAVFDAVADGAKTHEIRFNDRDYQVGDALELLRTEYSGEQMRNGAPLIYSGRVLHRRVTHVQEGYGLQPGWVILSLSMPEGEPVFTLRAQDLSADRHVDNWADAMAIYVGESHPKVLSARKIAEAMRAWPHRKVPD